MASVNLYAMGSEHSDPAAQRNWTVNLKSIVLASATLIVLAAPAAALADPEWGHDRGYHERDYRRDRGDWRRSEYRAYDRREGRYDRGYARSFVENRGYYNWSGEYVSRPVEVCR